MKIAAAPRVEPGMTLAVPCSLLCAGAMAAAGAPTDASLPEFGRCLAARRVSTRLADNRKSLELPARLPAQRTLDAAFAACRQFVRWPRDFVHVGRILYRLRESGRRFRACMRSLGDDPGPPVLFLARIGVGLHFRALASDPPPTCARLLPGGFRP
jgi:hypothetical protein